MQLLGEWITVGEKNRSNIDYDKIYYRYIETKYKTMKLSISIGNTLAESFGWKKDDTVKICYSRLNPLVFAISRCNNPAFPLYTLHQGKLAHCVHLSFKSRPGLKLDIKKSIPACFEFDGENLLLDLSKKHESMFISVGRELSQ